MKKIIHILKKEAVLKIDFVNNEFEIGWIWVILQIPSAYLYIRNALVSIF